MNNINKFDPNEISLACALSISESTSPFRPTTSSLDTQVKKIVKEAKYTFTDVPGDGNCFFHAIAYCLKRKKENHMTLREKTIKQAFKLLKSSNNEFTKILDLEIASSQQQQERYLQAKNKSDKISQLRKDYLKNMKKCGTYAGPAEVYAIAVLLGKKIDVLEANKEHNTLTKPYGYRQLPNQSKQDTLSIYYDSKKAHFSALKKR